MKKFPTRAAMTVALTWSLGLGVPAAAFASSPPTTGTTVKAPSAWSTWRATWTTFIHGITAINDTYHASLKSARSTLSSALSTATNKTERDAARAAFTTALITAMDTRVTAITTAGMPPAPPAGFNGTAFFTGFHAARSAYWTAVASAESRFTAALASATTASQRTAARAALKSAVSAALIARTNALSALGSRPAKPGKPLG